MVSSGDPSLIIALNRTVYTDGGGATLEYRTDGATDWKKLSLDENTNSEFLGNTEIQVTSGHIYLFDEGTAEKLIDLDSIRGIPVLP